MKVIDISEVTGFPEILDGRVKTLHPRACRHPRHPRQCGTHGCSCGAEDRADRSRRVHPTLRGHAREAGEHA
ncbi:MAG: hypothetical protein U0744_04235 [Gemmataceae bacterium]